MSRRRVIAVLGCVALMLGISAAITHTRDALLPLPDRLPPLEQAEARALILDVAGHPLAVTYGNTWNRHDIVALHEVPPLLRQAFVAAEDRRFFEHGGVDWRARLAAVWQNARAGRAVRGASTISEQVVRMLHPRPRTLRSRWLEGFEAARLERRFTKGEILEFYLNQVPYARRRRGVVQAARDSFDRDLETLSPGEMLALAALVRAPGRWDLRRSTSSIEAPVGRLAAYLLEAGALDARQYATVVSTPLDLRAPRLAVDAPHFVRFVRERTADSGADRVTTFLDPALQRAAREILERQLERLSRRQVGDGAVLVVDHASDRVLAWVNAGEIDPEIPGSAIDAVLAPRQPGSTLKPFLYATAMERAGWTAATLISDSPLAEAVGAGLHRYRNYSRYHYGPVRLREALGNSLNVPAVRAVQEIGVERFHERLERLGITTLDLHPRVYGDGLALGNGEVTLYDLVGAYAALARGGVWRPLIVSALDPVPAEGGRRVFDEETASLIADILSDREARRKEFGEGGALEFPRPTAVKTGTSNDYRDAWAVGFSERHVVGVWLGNLDRREMNGVSGAAGPALVLRGVFAELQRTVPSEALFLSRKLRRERICAASGALAGPGCPAMDEWFKVGTVPATPCRADHRHAGTKLAEASAPSAPGREPRFLQPTPGLLLASDPRIPDGLEAFELRLDPAGRAEAIEWFVDDRLVGRTSGDRPSFAWALEPGEHTVRAVVWRGPDVGSETRPVSFVVRGAGHEAFAARARPSAPARPVEERCERCAGANASRPAG